MLKYRYPKLKNWLSFNRLSSGEYELTDHLEKEQYIFSPALARFAMRLDGRTDPRTIFDRLSEEEAVYALRQLEKYKLLRRSRIMSASWRGVYLTLWTPKARWKPGKLPAFLNAALLLLFLPVFLLGCYALFHVQTELSDDYMLVNIVLGSILGITLHELAHSCAALACGAPVFEAGVALHYGFPSAYVLMDTEELKGTLPRVQANAAGVEANLFLTGAAFLLAAYLPWNSGGFLGVGIINLCVALLNMLFFPGMDGARMISELLGIEDLEEAAWAWLSRKKIERGRTDGALKKVYSTILFSVALLQPAFLCLMAVNVWVIVSWFQ